MTAALELDGRPGRLRPHPGAARRQPRGARRARSSRCSGPNGVGKTTTLRAISGTLPVTSGLDPPRRPAHRQPPARAPSPPRGVRARARGPRACSRRSPCRTTSGSPTAACRATSAGAVGGVAGGDHRDLPAPRRAAGPGRRARCPAASSRCSPCAGPSVGDPQVVLFDELSMGLAPLVVAELFEQVADAARRRAARSCSSSSTSPTPSSSPTSATCSAKGGVAWAGEPGAPSLRAAAFLG